MDNEKQYIEECKNFKWLQEQWKPKSGDKVILFDEVQILVRESSVDGYWQVTTPEGGSKIYTQDDFYKEKCIYLPRLSTLIELLGDRFRQLWRNHKFEWLCEYWVWDRKIAADVAVWTPFFCTPKLACLRALKKVKGE